MITCHDPFSVQTPFPCETPNPFCPVSFSPEKHMVNSHVLYPLASTAIQFLMLHATWLGSHSATITSWIPGTCTSAIIVSPPPLDPALARHNHYIVPKNTPVWLPTPQLPLQRGRKRSSRRPIPIQNLVISSAPHYFTASISLPTETVPHLSSISYKSSCFRSLHIPPRMFYMEG